MHAAIAAVQEHPKVAVPLHLRNAPTNLMKDLGYGENYEYPHESEEGFAAGVQYLPDELGQRRFYEPAARGYEVKIGERLRHYKSLSATKEK